MAIIELRKAGRPLHRVRWNYRTCPETGRKLHDERDFRDRSMAEAFAASITPVTTTHTARLTVSELLALWQHAHHPDHATGRAKAWQLRTRKDREQQASLRIVPFLGRDRVSALTPQRIEAWLDWMLDPVKKSGGVRAPRFGSRVANKALQDLKAAVRWGRGKGLVENVYIDDVRGLPAGKPKPANPYPPSVVERIMEGCQHLRDATLIAVAAYSGLRWSELRGLEWGDIDWANSAIHVQRSIDLDRSVKAPKNGKPRMAPLLDLGMDALVAYRDAVPARRPNDWVFPNRNGDTLTAEWHRDRLPKIRAACGVHFDPHELRDTYASILIAAGIGEIELTMWLAHSSLQTTRDRYGQLFAARQTTLASKANSIIATLG